MKRGCGVAHEAHQNGPKWTKMITISGQSKSTSNLSWVTYMIFIWLNDTWKGIEVRRSYGGGHGIQKWIILVTQNKFEKLCSVMLWRPFWCILVHFGAPHVWPHDPFMTFPDSYPLSSVHLIQNEIILVTQDKFETLLLCHDMVTILVHFGPFWCTSWATPWPLSIEFSWSHQRYASYASRALKCDQSYFPSSICARDIDQTGPITMGKMDKRYHHLPYRKKSIFLKTAKGNILLRPILDWHACLLVRSGEKWWVMSQITWQFRGWHMRGKADFHEIET